MKNKIILVIKGLIIGIGNIIPGVSGGTIAISLGIYERLINIIANFRKNIKENILFLLPIGVGILLGILIMSNLILQCLFNYPLPTNVFFIGLILGGIPMLIKEIKDSERTKFSLFVLLVIIGSLILLGFLKQTTTIITFTKMLFIDYIKLFIVGIIGAGTTIIPGISGSFVLIVMGYYEPLLTVLTGLFNFYNLGMSELLNNIFVLIPFGLGLVVGLVSLAKIINYFFSHYKVITYYAIIGFIIGSIFLILKPLLIIKTTLPIIFLSIIAGMIGFFMTYYLMER